MVSLSTDAATVCPCPGAERLNGAALAGPARPSNANAMAPKVIAFDASFFIVFPLGVADITAM
jgi:hypothetical protein